MSVIRLMTLNPLPITSLSAHLRNIKTALVVEEVCSGSGICRDLAWELQKINSDCRVYGLDLGKNFVNKIDLREVFANCF